MLDNSKSIVCLINHTTISQIILNHFKGWLAFFTS